MKYALLLFLGSASVLPCFGRTREVRLYNTATGETFKVSAKSKDKNFPESGITSN
jgi:hypothetical protein